MPGTIALATSDISAVAKVAQLGTVTSVGRCSESSGEETDIAEEVDDTHRISKLGSLRELSFWWLKTIAARRESFDPL